MPVFTIRMSYVAHDVLETQVNIEAPDIEAAKAEALRLDEEGGCLDWSLSDAIQAGPTEINSAEPVNDERAEWLRARGAVFTVNEKE